MLCDVERFQHEVLRYPVPDRPTYLTGDAYGQKIRHLNEEMIELMSAHDIEGQADALVDIAYVALGALIQMGICPGAAFEEVHNRNMARELRDGDNRFGGQTPDAVKPKEWTPPKWAKLLSITLADVERLIENRLWDVDRAGPEEAVRLVGPDRGRLEAKWNWRPKILVIGYARHGKDTVSEMLRDQYDFSFTSSSQFCAEQIIMPVLAEKYGYETVGDCFEDRGNHRAEWYGLIRAFNTPDAAALGRAIFTEHDVYCGLRSSTELHALRNAGVFDFCIWVDADDRHETESVESCTVQAWMADFVLDNNGTLEDLERNLHSLMQTIMDRC